MSKTIDERVVSMQFDNKNFESNVRTSMGTLEKLKKSLNFKDAEKSLQGLEEASKKVTFNEMGNSIETIQTKFSHFQMTVQHQIDQLVDRVVAGAERMVKSLTIDQVTAGWNKYEQKTASVQTIMNSTGMSIDEVNRVLEQLMWFSDETSYGFNDMTAALAQMTSSGGDVKKLIPLITGVANATAFAGKGASEFSRAMFNLNQSYGAGYLQLMDWRSLELVGIAGKDLKQTFIDVAEELGKIEKGTVNIGNFSQTLSDKWADTEVMEKAFSKFSQLSEEAYKLVESGQYDTAAEAIEALSGKYDDLAERAFKSAQEAKSFTEAIEATKDAVSSGWMRTFEIIFGNYEEAKVLWTDLANTLWDVFASGAENRNNILEGALGSKWDQFYKQINEAGIATEQFEARLMESFRNAGVPIDKLIEQFGSFREAIKHLDKSVVASHVKKVLDQFAKSAEGVTGTTEKMSESLEHYQDIVNKVIRGDFGSGKARIDALTKSGENQVLVQKLVNKVWEKNGKTWKNTTISAEDLAEAISELSTEELESIGYTEEQAEKLKELAKQAEETGTPINELIESLNQPSGRELLIDSVKNIFQALVKIISPIKEAWSEIFDPIDSNGLYKVIKAFHKFTTTIQLTEDKAEQLKSTFKGLFSVLKVFKDVVVNVFGAGFKIGFALFKAFGSIVLKVTSIIGDFLTEITDAPPTFKSLSKVVNKVVDVIGAFSKKTSNLISKVLKPLTSVLSNVIKFVKNFYSAVKENFSGVSNAISDTLSNWKKQFEESAVFKACSKYFEEGSEAIKTALDNLKAYFNNFDFSGITKKFEKVGEFFSKIGKKLSDNKVIKTIAGDITSGLETFYNSIKNFKLPKFDGEKLLTSFSKFFDKFSGIMKRDNLSGIGGNITGFFKTIKEMFSAGFTKGLKNLQNKAITAFSEFYIKHGDSIKKGFEKCREVMSSIIQFVLGTEEISVPAILEVVEKIYTILLLYRVFSILGNITGSFSAISETFENFAKYAKWKAIGSAFKSMAIALGAFTVCLIILNRMDAKQTRQSAEILAGVLIVMGTIIGILMFLASKINGAFNLAATVGSIVGIAIALAILVGVLKTIDGMEFKDVGRSLAIMTGVLISMALSMGVIGLLCKNNVPSVFAILTMLTALKMILEILEDYAKYDWKSVEDAIPKFAAALIGLAFALRIASGGVKQGASASGLALLMLSLVFALKMILKVVKQLADMDSKEMWQGIAGISTLLIVIMAMLAAINKTSQGGILKKGEKSINGFAGLAKALLAVAATIWILGTIGTKKLLKGGAAVITILGMFSLLFKAIGSIKSSGLDTVSLLGVFAGFGLLLAGMYLIVKDLSSVGWANAIGAAAALSLLLIAMAGCMKILSTIDVSNFKNIVKIIGAFALLSVVAIIATGAIRSMEGLDGKQAILQVTALSELLLAMSACMKILMKHSRIKAENIFKWIGALALLSVVAIIATGALHSMKDLDGAQAILQVTALSELLLIMAGCLAICSWIGPMASAAYPAMGALAVFALGLVAFLGTLGLIDELTKGGLEQVMERAVVIMELTGKAIGAFLGGIIAGGLEAITSVLPKIGTDLSNFMSNASGFFDGLEKMNDDNAKQAAILSAVITALVAESFLTELANKITGVSLLPKLGTDLTAFMSNGKYFFDKLADIDETTLAGATALSNMLKTLAEAGLEDTISKLLNFGKSGIGELGKQLDPFADAIVGFSEKVSGKNGINLKGIKDACTAGSKIAEMASNLPPRERWYNSVTDLGTFGTDLATFAEAVVGFSEAVSTEGAINKEAVGIACEASQLIINMAATLPKRERWYNSVTDLGTFGVDLASFAGAIVGFSKVVSMEGAINKEAVGIACEASQLIVNMAATLPKRERWYNSVTDLGTFGTDLPSFAGAIVGFSKVVSEEGAINKEAVELACGATESIINMAASLPERERWYNSVSSLGTFGEDLATYGEGFKSFADEISEISDIAKVTTIIDHSVTLSNLLKKLVDYDFGGTDNFIDALKTLGGGYESFFGYIEDVNGELVGRITSSVGSLSTTLSGLVDSDFSGTSNFTSALKTLGVGVGTFFEKIIGINAELVASLIDPVWDLSGLLGSLINYDFSGTDGFVGALNKLGTVDLENLISAFENASERMSQAATIMFTGFVDSAKAQMARMSVVMVTTIQTTIIRIVSTSPAFANAGRKLVTAFAKGIKSGSAAVKSTASSMVKQCAASLSGQYNAFYSAGQSVADGFAAGISANSYKAKAKAKAMAEAAAQAAKEALDINSPSKVFRSIAYSIPEGFAQGIDRMSWMSEESSKKMADSTVESANNALSIFFSKIQNGFEAEPTIRPVVDFSGVDKDSLKLRGIINTSLTKPIGSLSQLITDAQADINASNNEVISAINGLREDLATFYSADKEVALYVDSKKLASSLAKPMNRQLNILSQRGSY